MVQMESCRIRRSTLKCKAGVFKSVCQRRLGQVYINIPIFFNLKGRTWENPRDFGELTGKIAGFWVNSKAAIAPEARTMVNQSKLHIFIHYEENRLMVEPLLAGIVLGWSHHLGWLFVAAYLQYRRGNALTED